MNDPSSYVRHLGGILISCVLSDRDIALWRRALLGALGVSIVCTVGSPRLAGPSDCFAQERQANEKSPYPPAKSPADSLKSIELLKGFQIELVASEPLVMDPISIAWGPDGKLWVVEMGGYPTGKKGGRIKCLQDEDGDGKFDRSTIFLSGLQSPGSVLPWKDGLLVACAPEIFFAQDSDGDGKADQKQVILSGFGQSNPQHQVNGLTWGLDNWVHAANGDSSGVIVSPLRKQQPPLDIHAHDVRFRPSSGEAELESGMSQFIRCRDDWANWFGGNSSWPFWHDVLPERYLQRNLHWAPPEACQYVTEPAANPPVFPRSSGQPRLNEFGRLNRITSACGVNFYRDTLFGPEFRRSIFICEPANNLVHHETLVSKGVSFRGRRPRGQEEIEFLASHDVWFRPTQAITGPDGALWVVDMYRLIIEHPDFFERAPELLDPADVVGNSAAMKALLRTGEDRGRIYRISPIGMTLRTAPNLTNADAAGLLQALSSPNGTQRDLAHRLLLERKESANRQTLEDIASNAPSAAIRIQALATLDGLGQLEEESLVQALRDSHPAVQRFATRLAETRFESDSVLKAVVDLAPHVDPKVRLQAALSLGESDSPLVGQALAQIAVADIQDPHIVAAVVSSSARHGAELIQNIVRRCDADPSSRKLIVNLLRSAHGNDQYDVLAAGLGSLAKTPNDRDTWRWEVIGGFLDSLDAATISLAELLEFDAPLPAAVSALNPVFASARKTAIDSNRKQEDRLAAMLLLGRGVNSNDADLRLLGKLLSPRQPLDIQRGAVSVLAKIDRDQAAQMLLLDWSQRGPSVRAAILEAMFARKQWTIALVQAIESGQLSSSSLSLVQRERLLLHYFKDVRQLAAKVLKHQPGVEVKIADAQKAILQLEGDPQRGANLFVKHCAACHASDERRFAGPPLASLRRQSPNQLVVSILRPSQSIEPAYASYTAITQAGTIVTGVITHEAGASLRMTSADGKKHVLLRSNLEVLKVNEKSLMPEGFSRELPQPQDLADLIALIRSEQASKRVQPLLSSMKRR